jgi:hypothetical protein
MANKTKPTGIRWEEDVQLLIDRALKLEPGTFRNRNKIANEAVRRLLAPFATKRILNKQATR